MEEVPVYNLGVAIPLPHEEITIEHVCAVRGDLEVEVRYRDVSTTLLILGPLPVLDSIYLQSLLRGHERLGLVDRSRAPLRKINGVRIGTL